MWRPTVIGMLANADDRHPSASANKGTKSKGRSRCNPVSRHLSTLAPRIPFEPVGPRRWRFGVSLRCPSLRFLSYRGTHSNRPCIPRRPFQVLRPASPHAAPSPCRSVDTKVQLPPFGPVQPLKELQRC